MAPFVIDGRVRALGVSGPHRSPAFPDVPIIAEPCPGYVAVTWLGVVAPAKTPRPIVEKLNRAVNEALKSPVDDGAVQDDRRGSRRSARRKNTAPSSRPTTPNGKT